MEESTQQALVISPGDVPAWNVVGESIRCLMSAEQTKGQYALFDFDSRSGGGHPCTFMNAKMRFSTSLKALSRFKLGRKSYDLSLAPWRLFPQESLIPIATSAII